MRLFFCEELFLSDTNVQLFMESPGLIIGKYIGQKLFWQLFCFEFKFK